MSAEVGGDIAEATARVDTRKARVPSPQESTTVAFECLDLLDEHTWLHSRSSLFFRPVSMNSAAVVV